MIAAKTMARSEKSEYIQYAHNNKKINLFVRKQSCWSNNTFSDDSSFTSGTALSTAITIIVYVIVQIFITGRRTR